MPYTTLELIAGSLKNLFAIMSNIPFGAPSLERQVPTERIAVLGETPEERGAVWARVGHGRTPAEHTDARDFGRGLGEDRARPCDRGTA